jgi:hypothetical protein
MIWGAEVKAQGGSTKLVTKGLSLIAATSWNVLIDHHHAYTP